MLLKMETVASDGFVTLWRTRAGNPQLSPPTSVLIPQWCLNISLMLCSVLN